jgi:DNA-binding transcriptional LysR family regulator
MELRQLATFRMLAATLNFTRAAAALGYVQSSVTAQIQALEEDLGVPLFDRLGKRVALTDAGRQFLPYAERMLDLAEEARGALSDAGEPVGVLAIGAPETLCTYRLPGVLRRFRELYPLVRVAFSPGAVAELPRRVSDGLIDVALVMDEPLQFTGLVVEPLVEEPLCVLAPVGHPLAGMPSVNPADLEGEPLLLTEVGCRYRNMFTRALAAAGVHPASSLEFSSIEAIKQCVIAGMGITVLPAVAVAEEVERGQLAALGWADPGFGVLTQMVWHKDKWLSPALRAFLDVTRETLVGSQPVLRAATQ